MNDELRGGKAIATGVSLPAQMRKRLDQEAAATDRKRSVVVQRALELYFSQSDLKGEETAQRVESAN